MKKKILCLILASLMLICSLPLTVFADQLEGVSGTSSQANNGSLPVVKVTSLYSYDPGDPMQFRAFPDNEGTFYLDIFLDRTPTTDENILVYYRTIDDTAVAKWGDYESAGTDSEAYVTLNKANGYKARVIVKSKVLPHASYVEKIERSLSRRFLFELTRVEGKAVLHEADPDDKNDRCESELYCYLEAEKYFRQIHGGYQPAHGFTWQMGGMINTPFLYGKDTFSQEANFRFEDDIKTIMSTGDYYMGVCIIGKCIETLYQNDGPVTFDLYYTYQGVKRKALTLIIEGEFDENTFFGWEHAFDWLDGDYSDEKRNEMYKKEYDRSNKEWKLKIDIDDYIKDNFDGYILYDNDGNVSHKVMKENSDSGDLEELRKALRASKREGYATRITEVLGDKVPKFERLKSINNKGMVFLRLPSNFVFADSYSWSCTSDGDSGEGRKLEDVAVLFQLLQKDPTKIEKDENDSQLVTSNIDQLREGDPLRMMIRFNHYVFSMSRYGNIWIEAKINGKYEIKLNCKNMILYGADKYGTWSDEVYCWDTFVFEGELPEELKGVNITSITDISLKTYQGVNGIFSYSTTNELMSYRVDDIRGTKRDLRTPVASLSVKSSEFWAKSKPLDIYVNTKENNNSRFNDYATVYYQWSNSPELPETYSYNIAFHTSADGEIIKTIIGTGDGRRYLHMKTVSIYGKSSISDSVTGTYDPEDENATYTPFGPFLFDNTAPEFPANAVTHTGSLREQTISVYMPEDKDGSGVKELSLYYIGKDSQNGEGTFLHTFAAESFSGNPQMVHKITHDMVGVGVDGKGNTVPDRQEVEFYWIISDMLGNTSGKTGRFKLIFDTHDYLDDDIEKVGPYNASKNASDAQFVNTTYGLENESLVFIYNYRLNKNKTVPTYATLGKVYYGFSFKIKNTSFNGNDKGVYTAKVFYKGEEVTDTSFYKINEESGVYVVWFLKELRSGRYDIQLTRKEGESTRVSQIYSVYATDNEEDSTTVKNKIESGTLLNNTVYQLSTQYPYFYYKDRDGKRQHEYYNGIKQPATFSSYSKAKEYVYYKELGDIHLEEISTTIAGALNSGTTGYLKASGETVTAQAGQYWIRYKSASWTPTSGDSAWVYYYYGTSGDLTEGSFSLNLQNALNTVANRIVNYGKQVILTDTSLFLGSPMTDKMLDENGMPYLLDAQIHDADESSDTTKCGDVWSMQVFYLADRNIYNSKVHVGQEGSEAYGEFPIIGNFAIPGGSVFQYMTYADYHSAEPAWKPLDIKEGESFFKVLPTTSVYYIREISNDGIATYSFYVDKEAPQVSFSNTDEMGSLNEIPIDGVEILDIRTKDLFIGSISAAEHDRLSYVAIYRVSNLSLVGIYTADMLETDPVKLGDGNYYIVVSDRSGNHYTVTAKISSTDLECQIKETKDKFVKITCNRRSDQILRYEVYLNNELLTSTYAADQTFDKAGIYTVYIQDIYGNYFSKEYTFTRSYPVVTWKYLGEDGKYYVYDPKITDPNNSSTNGFVMTEISNNQYKISTSVKTRFSFSGDYVYEFIGAEPEHNKTIGAETVVTIEAGQSFSLKVSYKNYSDCYVIYSAIVDITPPTINVLAEVDIVTNGERALFNKWLENAKEGDIISLKDIYYTISKKERRVVASGGTVSSDIIMINANDINDLVLLEVYLDGKLVKQQDVTTGFSQIVVGRWGSYRVVAKDTLGNISEFTFTNGNPDELGYFVDGVKKDVELHGYLNFKEVDGKHVYTKVDYGNSNFKIDLKKNADVFISVGVSGGNTEIYGFRTADGILYPLSYKVVLDSNGEEMIDLVAGAAILDMNSEDFNLKNEYEIGKAGSHKVYASIDSNKVVSIKVYGSEDSEKVTSVSARIEFIGSNTVFVSAEMSKKSSNVYFEENGVQTNSDIRVNSGFTIDESYFASERIDRVSLYYSNLNDLDVNNLKDKADIYEANFNYADEGFYMLIVRNFYGIDNVYKITISKTFGVTSSVTFGDGYKVHYSKDYNGKLYSNNEITLDILDEGVSYKVTLNGADYNGFVQKKEDVITYFVFSEEGIYEVKLTDSCGNEISRQLEINKSTYKITEGLLTGYNEKALKRDEGYTNQKLTVDKTVFDGAGIYYLAVKYGEKINVLFDAFAETSVEVDAQAFIDVVGADGDGVYTVICRNRYGAVVTQDIHYRGTPTLKLERTTRSKPESEIYDLASALTVGFWSNNTLSFSTDAKTYVFKINGSVTECPRTLIFEKAGDFGSFEYDISYIDEYGFEYNFKAYLVRKNVTIEVPSDITGIEIDGVLNTKKDISIKFGENVYAIYTRNNGEEMIYRSGDVLQKDGTYRFTVMDYAGNTTAVIIKKDTAVEFSFVDSISGNSVQNGGVVNASKVSFSALNKDSAYIEKAVRNGVVQTEFTGNKFTEDGKWEVILCDKLGNKAYFSFYIITRAQNGFEYTTPYEYRITELWYDSGDGVKISFLSFVNHTDFASSFNFTENGKYTVVMTSGVTGITSTFEFTVNTNAPDVSLVGCGEGETTINDVTLAGYKVGDRIKIYRAGKAKEELVEEVEITSLSTKIPTITEGGKYRIVVESEAGVQTELSFVRKHVMNTAGSVFVMVIIGLSVVGLFAGLVYRNKSKTDD